MTGSWHEGQLRLASDGDNAGGGDDEDEEEEEPKDEGKADAPLVYEHGLPVRPRKKMSVSDCTLRLLDHGQKPAVELTDAQKKLLGR